ncbi:RHS repeat-associated core domain-containing protein [Amycolatopsis sp.]|uniref:RHS repeat-associated core domain-containing protein n=1 Tax=Amycolatopsis sp. TaxID=37632 RepID=UPI002D8026D0|nr:RHS repeat-associated core domain-containing protein [Amycolatopsis sp.]HET6710855.1 RHS repeat-associated core domain-containing protein [Amycolatopsis sp.]
MPAPAAAAQPAAAPKPADFGPDAAKSADLAVDGYGDAQGYHVTLGREAAGFAWQEVALLHPAGFDDGSWTGYQCVSGDGKYAAVAILPASAVNTQAARDHGAFAYSVDLATGAVRALAGGVGLKYYSPGCGTGGTAVFTVALDGQTRLLTANLATGRIDADVTTPGQITSAVPAAGGVVGVTGNRLVSLPAKGKPAVVATLPGDVYDVRPAADGGVSFLHTKPGTRTATAAHEHEHDGTVTTLGSGDLTRVQLFQGRAGHAVLSGATPAAPGAPAAAGVRSVGDGALAHGAEASSLDGDALLGPDADGRNPAPALLATKTGKVLAPAAPAATKAAATQVPTYSAAPKPAQAPHQSRLSPKADAAPTTQAAPNAAQAAPNNTQATPNATQAAPNTTQAKPNTAQAAPNATQAQTPKCAVPPLTADRQVMQPSPAQVDWAVQLAEQGLLTGSAYTRPAGYANLGLAAYAPNSDFPLIPLSHPAGASNTVPRSIFEGIMAQESNWSQASWHAPAGTAGDPLIASYYGAGGDIVSINYAASDCGYGISQVTDGMHIGDTSLSAHGQWKVAVDYQENIAAGLQILESTWNQLYADGITANNADPRYLENWYFAAWAYNSGIQPNAANGNTTGCTPGPSCTGPHGTWGLGWTNNPANLDYPPNRDPYLRDTYADAAHPASWPYQERVLGWTASPLIRYSKPAYAKPTYNGGQSWVQPAPYTAMCALSANQCDPNNTNTSNPGASHCMLDDFQCWWHNPVTWIPSCATTCATSPYAVSGGSEPANPTQNPPTCGQDTSKVPSGSIIVDDEPNRLNLQGCGGANWSSNGTFTYTYGTNSAGDPIGAIDTHQLGTGLGGRVLFTHTEDGSNPALINTGVWTPNLPSLQYYKVKLHLPGLGAQATNVVYSINPGGGVAPWKIRVNQAWNSEQWVTIGTFAMQNGGNVTLTNNGSSVDNGGFGYSDFDVAFDAVAFVPQGGTPGQPIGGPPGIQDAPRGSNPAFIACGCAKRTAGDPVDTSTGYFGDSFTDLATPGRGMALNFARSYAEGIADPNGPNKALAADGPFGWGWTYSYNLTAATDGTTGNVTVKQEDGSAVTFVDTNGTYAPAAPRYDATLVKTGSNYVYTRRGTAIFTFDAASGRLTAETDRAGTKAVPAYQTTLAYDGSGHLATITDPAGREYTLTWTGNHITGLADTAGRQVTYGYDGTGNLTDVYGVGTTRTPVLKDDDHAKYTYDGNHLMTSMRSPANFAGPASAVTSMAYDSAERVHTQTDANGHTTTFTYGPDGGLTAGQTLVTDPSGHRKLDTYQNGLLVAETKGSGTADAGTTSYTYDPVTLGVSTQTDPDGNLRTFTYDDHGNKTSESDALGFTTDYVYDDAGNLVETIDPNGVATVNAYDQDGHIPAAATGVRVLTSTTVTQANNVVESTTGNFGPAPTRTVNHYYDDAAHPGDRTRTVDPNGKTTAATFDAFGDRTSTTDGAGNKTQYGYNTTTGLLTSTVDGSGTAAGVTPGCTPPSKGCTTYGRDAYGHVVRTTDPLGHATSETFDADGNRTSTTNANGHKTISSYDPVDQLTKVTQADNTSQITEYNPDGTTADTIDGLNAKTTFGYDGQGRKNSRVDPDNRTSTVHMDPAGRILTSTDPAGRVTTNGYDAAGRVKSVSYSDGVTPNVTYGYDPAGHRVSMTDGTGTTTWTYDAFGEIKSQVQGSGTTVGYGYDDYGNRTSITYPGQATPVVRTFDDAERLKTVTDWNNNSTTFGYDNDGAVKTVTYPNGTTVTNGYDDNDVLTSTTAATGATTLLSMTFGRDPMGQLSARTAGSTSQSFGYSPREQLSADGVTGYADDAADNPVTVGSATQAFDAAGQLCWSLPSGTVSSPSCGMAPTGATAYTFDKLGERKTDGTHTYGYDQAGRLSSFTGATSVTYTYNGDNLRSSKTSGGSVTSFVWDADSTPNLLSDGVNSYLYGPSGLPVEQLGSGGSFWFVHDQNGSTTALLGGGGTVAGTYSYSAYGRPAAAGSARTPLQYTGQYVDSESGLVYLRARYYDPVTAVFLTVDPLVDTTRTPYTYAGGNPLNYADPTGYCSFWECLGIGAGVAGMVLGAGACIVLEPCGLGVAAAGAGAAALDGAAIFGAGLAGAAAGLGGVGIAHTMSTSEGDFDDDFDDDFEGTGFSQDEVAEFANSHAGDGNPAMGRPKLSEIQRTLKNGKTSPGGGNSVRYDCDGVRVIVNRDMPWRSTAYYPGR